MKTIDEFEGVSNNKKEEHFQFFNGWLLFSLLPKTYSKIDQFQQ